MESRIIYHIEKFIAFLFGKENVNDTEQRIYNKLLQLEGDELEGWINAKVKKYITGKDYLFEFSGENFEGIDGPTSFKDWYVYNIRNTPKEVMRMEEIYGKILYTSVCFTKEYKTIKDKIQIFKERFVFYDMESNWRLDTITDYIEMYIMSMSSDDLKNFIIQQVDPVEIR
jgi:hypothetical protein